MVAYVDNWDYWSDPVNQPYQYSQKLGTTDIAFSPSWIGSSLISYTFLRKLDVQLQSHYVSKQYIDNTNSELRKLDQYFVNDLRFSWSFDTKWTKDLSLNFMIANLFNTQYITNAWVYRYVSEGEEGVLDGYFPQAGIHVMGGVRVRF